MKHLKLFTLALCLLGAANALNAQGFYIQPGVSYLAPATNEVLGPKNVLTSGAESSGSIVGSYGSGIGLDLTLGYMLSRNFGFELGSSYVLGKETMIEEFVNGESYDRSYATNKRLTLSPGIVVDAGNETLSPFARFGVLIPVAGQTDGRRVSNDPALISALIPSLFPDATDFEATSIAKGQFSVGFNAAFGLRYQVNNMISVFGSVGYTGLRIARKSYEVPGAYLTMTDGTEVNVLSLLTLANTGAPDDVYAYEEYVDGFTAAEIVALQETAANAYMNNPPESTGNVTVDLFRPATYYGTKDYPALKTRQDVSFSTINISIGARFTFGGNSDE